MDWAWLTRYPGENSRHYAFWDRAVMTARGSWGKNFLSSVATMSGLQPILYKTSSEKSCVVRNDFSSDPEKDSHREPWPLMLHWLQHHDPEVFGPLNFIFGCNLKYTERLPKEYKEFALLRQPACYHSTTFAW